MNTFGWKGNFWPLWFILGNHQKCSFWVFFWLENVRRSPRSQGLKEQVKVSKRARFQRSPKKSKKSQEIQVFWKMQATGWFWVTRDLCEPFVHHHYILRHHICDDNVHICDDNHHIYDDNLHICDDNLHICDDILHICDDNLHICDDIPAHMWW